jgi:hypothetical protein
MPSTVGDRAAATYTYGGYHHEDYVEILDTGTKRHIYISV